MLYSSDIKVNIYLQNKKAILSMQTIYFYVNDQSQGPQGPNHLPIYEKTTMEIPFYSIIIF